MQRKTNLEEIKNKVVGSMIGGAVGDALGYQIEFEHDVKEKQVTKYKNDFGRISDDTQMSLFTANAILWANTRNYVRPIPCNFNAALYDAYLDWYDTQTGTNNHHDYMNSWIKEDKRLWSRRGPGYGCMSSLASGKMGTIDNPINTNKGCGGIMRVAPIGLLYDFPRSLVGELAQSASAITHGHPLGIIPSYIYARIINSLAYYDMDLETAIYESIGNFMIYGSSMDKLNSTYCIELIEKAINLTHSRMSDLEAINKIGRGKVAEETLAIAIYSCLKHKDSFIDAVICAVNHSGDSDSTGALAGYIMGAYLGYDSIPSYYIENLELNDLITEIAEDLSIPCPIDEDLSDKKWEDKYLR